MSTEPDDLPSLTALGERLAEASSTFAQDEERLRLPHGNRVRGQATTERALCGSFVATSLKNRNDPP